MNDPVRHLIKGAAVAVSVVIAATTSKGIDYNGDLAVLFAAVIFLSILNMILKPLLVLLALPFIIVTLGFGFWIINALLFMLVGALVPGFEVHSFWSALWGSFCISIGAMLAEIFVSGKGEGGSGGPRVVFRSGSGGTTEQPARKIKDDDVIDV